MATGMIGNQIRRWLDRRAEQHRQAIRTTRQVHGVLVVLENPYPNIDDEVVIARLEAALALIARQQPNRFRHFQRDVLQVWVTRYPCRGVYFPARRTVMTEVTFLNRTDVSVAQVASSILHEGVHARVHRMGEHLGFRREWAMAEEERLCRRAEIAFARTLSCAEGAPILARATAVLAPATTDGEAAPVVDWREANFNKFADDVRQMEAPAVVKRVLLVFGRWRMRVG